ncbi:2,3-diaminopropionate biosynthesis protein SbnA [Kitasatospora nipponensis]|uniref:2,3-diaminopropionate biosynthesis protein SbnA n=1 Tax=Kitasatospora nipponensis TaxID=258049 RepID=A0ABP4H2K1_9ACTN
MIYRRVQDIVLDDVFLDLPGFLPQGQLLLKLEGLNPAGSIKLKTAVGLVRELETSGRLGPGRRLIESTSGNLGIALAVVCAQQGYPLTLVTDPNVSRQARLAMLALGADVVTVTRRDANGGFLQTRIDYIRQRTARDPDLVWVNQYANPANAAAHRERTAEQLYKVVGSPDALVVGVGTSGTLMGCLEFFTEHSPHTRIIAADSEGSVTFGGPAAARRIPGLGTSRRPEIFRDTGSFEKVVVAEADTVRMCRRIAREYGLLVGGSTGTALAAAERTADPSAGAGRTVVISPDLGDKYLDTVYADSWVAQAFTPALLAPAAVPTPHPVPAPATILAGTPTPNRS